MKVDRERRDRWMWVRNVVLALGLVAVVATVGGCGDDDDDTTEPTATSPGDAVSADEEALAEASDDLVDSCATRDRDRLRDLLADGVRDRIRDQDQLVAEDVEDVAVVSRDIAIDGDTATITVTLAVTIDGETTEVDRVWAYERIDGVWVLSDVPDCLFR